MVTSSDIVCSPLHMIIWFIAKKNTVIHTSDTTEAYTPAWWVACPSWSCARVSRPWSTPASWRPRQPPEPYSLHPERSNEGRKSSQSEEELVNCRLLAGELAQMIEGSEDKYEEGRARQKETWMGEKRGLGGIVLFQIHISSCWEASQVYFHIQSIWCEISSIQPLYVAAKYSWYRLTAPNFI